MFGYSARQKTAQTGAPLAAIQVYIWRSLDAYQHFHLLGTNWKECAASAGREAEFCGGRTSQSAINHQPKWNRTERFRSKTERPFVPQKLCRELGRTLSTLNSNHSQLSTSSRPCGERF
jgi:hypothetical protein